MAAPSRATPRIKKKAREMYEEGFSYAAIGREVGYESVTVSRWVKAGNWLRNEDKPTEAAVTPDFIPDLTAGLDDTTSAPDVTFTPVEPVNTAPAQVFIEESDAELQARVEELERRNAHLEAENQKLNPVVDISGWIEDRVQWITDNSPEGEKHWIRLAEQQYKQTNRDRAKEGLPTYDIKDNPEILSEIVAELKAHEEAWKLREPEGPPSRKVKMLIYRNEVPTIEQIPFEGQINNMKGSLADGIVRYTRKGFKLTSPFLCPRNECFRPAASDEFQRWMHDGYCTAKHRTEVEGSEPSQVGPLQVQVRDTVSSGL